MPNHSIEGTVNGLRPSPAPHVKRYRAPNVLVSTPAVGACRIGRCKYCSVRGGGP